jgi:hypothetical protein
MRSIVPKNSAVNAFISLKIKLVKRGIAARQVQPKGCDTMI